MTMTPDDAPTGAGMPTGVPAEGMVGGVFEPAPPLAPPPLPPLSRRDKWAHRRAEPRVFAFFWTVFLLIATVYTFGSAASGRLDAESGRFAARSLLVVLAVGVAVLWPMTRLSQVTPREGGCVASAKDILVMIVPTQAVIWPLTLLGGWPIEVTACLAALLAGWTLAVGGLLAWALGPPDRPTITGLPPPERAPGWAWIMPFIALASSGPAVAVVTQPASGIEVPMSDMLSPLSAVLEVSRYRPWTGVSATARPEHWASAAAAGLIGSALWLTAWAAYRPPRWGA